jgi:hypothetical protein
MNALFSLRKTTIFAAICGTAYAAWAFQSHGVDVIVRNTEPATIRNVTVHVTGKAYDLGDIAPNAQKRVVVRPNNESHVEISFVDTRETEKRLVADCYFESSGYEGTLEVEIRDGEIVRQTDSIRLRMY